MFRLSWRSRRVTRGRNECICTGVVSSSRRARRTAWLHCSHPVTQPPPDCSPLNLINLQACEFQFYNLPGIFLTIVSSAKAPMAG